MEIRDTTNHFFELYSNGKLSFDLLDENYYKRFEHFEDYFRTHCAKTKGRIEESIEKYDNDIHKIRRVADFLPRIIQEVYASAALYFGFEVNIDFNLFVGAYGSNAYAYKYSVFLAIEKLPSLEEYVKVIVAHEIAHIYHNYILLEQTETNWESIPLMNGITSMYLEGVATYISKRLVPDMPESVYYSYDDSGEDWFSFCRGNQKEIARAFLEISNWDIDGLREWFRLSGGKIFGYTRLGYFLGTIFIEDKLKEIDEYKIYTLLADESFLSIGNQWLEKTAS
ncbi:aminopeptidase [Paenibacillus lycopersici]|uniref:Aminopeptidase n=1 Tax=Paenibacillus lycopersici TaxID=2704462 RepID=A0A6C0G5W5_9BACL|nr:DUF5700 domain-containing putative Zn-dependent protease [Paenibacillus lycopersici]QHT63169.1 aminopeptidase [Paenibacillus lycopersici]